MGGASFPDSLASATCHALNKYKECEPRPIGPPNVGLLPRPPKIRHKEISDGSLAKVLVMRVRGCELSSQSLCKAMGMVILTFNQNISEMQTAGSLGYTGSRIPGAH